MRSTFTYLCLFIGPILFFDVISYFFASESRTSSFWAYRLEQSDSNLAKGRGYYPQNYFQAHETRGFDIAPNVTANHHIANVGDYEIFSNSLGCFDRNEYNAREFQEAIYLAGDSFTWGYAPYEEKLGTLLEQTLEQPVLKCGVTNTGQFHQYRKFDEIRQRYGTSPSVVVVLLFPHNDFKDDFLFPRTTVIDGWLVDFAVVGPDGRRADVSRDDIKRKMKEIESRSFRVVWIPKLLEVSLFSNIVSRAWDRITVKDSARRRLDQLADYNSADHDFFAGHKEAIRQWRTDSIRHGYELIFALVPARERCGSKGSYDNLSKFITDQGIELGDFNRYLEQEGMDCQGLYWKKDPHLNKKGNKVYSDFLYQTIIRK